MRQQRIGWVFAALAALQRATLARAQPTPGSATIPTDAALQSEIARVAAATTDAELQTSLARLRATAGPDFGALIPQLVVFLVNATDVRTAMIPGVIIDRLQISPAQIRKALAPYRDTTDARLKPQIDNLLQGAGGAPPQPSGASPP
jgi:hypothetical protein